MNSFNLVGNISFLNELKTFATSSNNVSVLKFNVGYSNIGGKKTDFIPITVFNKQAENLAKYGFVGMKVCIEGHITTNQYTDRDGNKKNVLDLVADRIEYLSKQEQKTNTYNAPQEEQPFEYTPHDYVTPNDDCSRELGF